MECLVEEKIKKSIEYCIRKIRKENCKNIILGFNFQIIIDIPTFAVRFCFIINKLVIIFGNDIDNYYEIYCIESYEINKLVNLFYKYIDKYNVVYDDGIINFINISLKIK